jgi:hypothetical protein
LMFALFFYRESLCHLSMFTRICAGNMLLCLDYLFYLGMQD